MAIPPRTEAAEFWDAHYGGHSQIWSGRPNRVLLDETADLAPGLALDIGCGEAADAVWLARRGWEVTAVDVSRTALGRGARLAEAAGVGGLVDWQWNDLAHTFPSGEFDLVTAQSLHAPIDLPREEILRAAASATAHGGTLLIVGHVTPTSWARHPERHVTFPSPIDTARAVGLYEAAYWALDTCETRERQTTSPTGEPATIRDSVVKARRK